MDREPGRKALVSLLSVGLAAAGIGLSLLGRQFGYPALETRLGPGVTLLGAAVWIGFRALHRGRR